MHAEGLTPILNVSCLPESFAWFEKLGWQKKWDWGTPPTFGPEGDEGGDKGAWMSLWVDDVAAMYRHGLEQGLEVT
jgi:hypothetical protein